MYRPFACGEAIGTRLLAPPCHTRARTRTLCRLNQQSLTQNENHWLSCILFPTCCATACVSVCRRCGHSGGWVQRAPHLAKSSQGSRIHCPRSYNTVPPKKVGFFGVALLEPARHNRFGRVSCVYCKLVPISFLNYIQASKVIQILIIITLAYQIYRKV